MSAQVRHRVLVCEAHPGHGEPVARLLLSVGYDVRCCPDEESLIEAVAAQTPRVVVYELHHQLPVDLAILALVRRVVPAVPLVVVAGQRAGPAANALRALHPTVLEHEPVDREELHSAVRAAVRRSRRREARRPEPAEA